MQPPGVGAAASLCLVLGMATAVAAQETKLAECPEAVRKTIESEAKGSKVEAVRKEKADDETIYWAEAVIAGKIYAIGVLEDGTLAEMNLAVAEAEVTLEMCPSAVQAAFRRESLGEPIKAVGKDMKYGVPIYEGTIAHRGRSYVIIVAEDGTLVEKVLVIEDEEIELTRCPATVQAALRQQARGGKIGDITRSAGIIHPTFEAEVEIRGKVYLIEIAENGLLISKSLEAADE